jgi:hypothetical protein
VEQQQSVSAEEVGCLRKQATQIRASEIKLNEAKAREQVERGLAFPLRSKPFASERTECIRQNGSRYKRRMLLTYLRMYMCPGSSDEYHIYYITFLVGEKERGVELNHKSLRSLRNWM